jgi:ATP phosphoribosyltransferase
LVEKGGNIELFKIRFSKCKVSVAVPKAFEYKSVKDLDGMRIATSYPKTVLDFFNSKGVTVDSPNFRFGRNCPKHWAC